MSIFTRVFATIVVVLWPGLSSATEQLNLAEISDYLNDITTLKSDFRQFNADGSVSTGTLYIRRPGRMRFEYDPPEQALVIAAASAVVIIDQKSNQAPETYPLSRTPLSLILDRDIDLTRARMVRNARFDGTATIVTAFVPDEPDAGYIELAFTAQPTRLRDWVITDATGGQTRIELGELETGMDLPATLFDADREKRRANR